jgi:hypothetical protein
LDVARCAHSNAVAGSQAGSHTRWRTAVSPLHVRLSVSSSHRCPKASMRSGAVARPTSADFAFVAWLVMVSRRTYSNPRLRRFRPLTPLSRCGCRAPEPYPARGPPPALRDRYRCRCDRFASGGDVSDVTVRRGPRLVSERCDPDVFHRVDLAARARNASAIVCTIPWRSVSGFALHQACEPGASIASLAIGPVLHPHDVTRVESPAS